MIKQVLQCLVLAWIVRMLLRWVNAPEGRGVDVKEEIERTLTAGNWWNVDNIANDIDERFKLRKLPPPKLRPYLRKHLQQMCAAGVIEWAQFRLKNGTEIRFRLITKRPTSGGPRQRMGVPTLVPNFGFRYQPAVAFCSCLFLLPV